MRGDGAAKSSAAVTQVTLVASLIHADRSGQKGHVPAARGGVVVLRIEPRPFGPCLAPWRAAIPDQARWRAGCLRTAVRLAGALTNAAIKAAPSSRSRTAESSRRCRKSHHSGPFPCPWIAGRPCFLHDARERDSLDELAGVPLTPLRFVRCTSTRSAPRLPAKPDAGPLNRLKCPPRLDSGSTPAKCGVGPWQPGIAR